MDKKSFIIFMLCLIVAALVLTGSRPDSMNFKDEMRSDIDTLIAAAKEAKKERAEILRRVKMNGLWVMVLMRYFNIIDVPHAVFNAAVLMAETEAAREEVRK